MEIKNLKQAIEAIQETSGLAGESNFILLDVDSFIQWYEKDISFCSEEDKATGEQVLAYLNKVRRYGTA